MNSSDVNIPSCVTPLRSFIVLSKAVGNAATSVVCRVNLGDLRGDISFSEEL